MDQDSERELAQDESADPGERRVRWLFILPSVLLLLFFALPLLALIIKAVSVDFLRSAVAPTALNALTLSLVTSSMATIVAAFFGTPLAYLLARWKFKHKSWIEVVLDLPIVLPPSVAGLALLMAFGRGGVFGAWLLSVGVTLPFTTAAVVLAQLFVAGPLYVRSARIGFSQIDAELEESARVEGASHLQLSMQIMVPLAARALATGAILTWTRAIGEFGATILFAGNLQGITQTMPMAIYLGLESDVSVALALAVMLILVSVILLQITRRIATEA